MKYTKEFEKLGLANYFKFGIELEADNVKIKGIMWITCTF